MLEWESFNISLKSWNIPVITTEGAIWKHKKVLVTGGASFIGSHLVDALVERGADVSIVDDLTSGRLSNIEGHLKNKRVSFMEADLREPGVTREAMKGTQIVFPSGRRPWRARLR